EGLKMWGGKVEKTAYRGNHKTIDQGWTWVIGLPSWTIGNVLVPPNSNYPSCNESTASNNGVNEDGNYPMTSRHPGGANIVLWDGWVRFLKKSVNTQTVWSLGSRNQGEVLSSDSY